MTSIVIKDLSESVELDRQAMTAITGGARRGGRQPFPVQTQAGEKPVVDYPPGFKGTGAKAAGKPAK